MLSTPLLSCRIASGILCAIVCGLLLLALALLPVAEAQVKSDSSLGSERTAHSSASSLASLSANEHGHDHALVFDESLGMFAHSDHSGIAYPFSPEALAQAAPTLQAAIISQTGVHPNAPDASPVSKHVVHQDSKATDSDADLVVDDEGNAWVAYTSFRGGKENIYIQRQGADDGAWSDEVLLGDSPGSDFNPTLGIDSDGRVWCVWSRQNKDGEWPLIARSYNGSSWSRETILASGKNYYPALVRIPTSGELILAWEDWNATECRIMTSRLSDKKWSAPLTVGDDSIPHQRPALACDQQGKVWLAYDVALRQKYELRLSVLKNDRWELQPPPPTIEGHRRRPSMAVDRSGRVWILPETEVIEPLQLRRAWNGQDVIYNVRPPCRAMLIWDGKDWKALPPGPAMSPKAASIHIDEMGTVWIFGRTPGPGTRDFLLVGQQYRGSNYYVDPQGNEPWDGDPAGKLEFQIGEGAIGSIKQPVSLVEENGNLKLAWHETKRQFVNDPGWSYMDGPVHTILHSIPIESDRYIQAEVVPYDPVYHGTDSPEVTPLPHNRMARSQEMAIIDGQPMEVYYGDMHHHTEYSRDPGVMNDDLDGNYRYVRDIRQLDFQGLADHAEHINPHDWYRIRRAAAFYNQGNRFAAMVAFEWTSEFYRGGNYQEGHHNVVYRTDGPEARVFSASLPQSNTPLRLIERIEEEIAIARKQNIEANTLLFPHDPSRWVQPISWSWYNPRIRLLELVQSRGNHEHLGSPQHPPLRNDFQQLLMGKSAQDGLAKGLRWGFVGSGDHRGRPVAGVYSPAGDRETLFDALYAKQTFATTGARMAINVSVNGHRMGSEWRGEETEHSIDIYAKGSKPITFVELWKNGRILWRWSPEERSQEFRVTHSDPSAPYFRENWWYVRVTQEDGEMAWSSPVWFIYEGIAPEIVSDAGGPEPHYMTPNYPIPIPVLMRNQGDSIATGRLALNDVPSDWIMEPNGPLDIELPPDSWKTYVWYVTAPADAIDSLKAIDLQLQVDLDNGEQRFHRVPCIQSPRMLNTRGQLSELNDAVYLQSDLDLLNQWLQTMEQRWWGN